MTEKNADFIAHAREDVPALIAWVKRLEELEAHMRAMPVPEESQWGRWCATRIAVLLELDEARDAQEDG